MRDAGREQRERELEERVRELHARDPEPAQTLDQLLESARAVKEGYRRRRERLEREVELQAQREAEERLRVRQRRKRRRTVRAREAKAVVGVAGSGNGSKCKRKRKGLGRDHGESMTQAGIADMLRGRVCTAGAVNSDTDPDSEGSEDEDRCRPRLRPGLRERHQREIEAMQGQPKRLCCQLSTDPTASALPAAASVHLPAPVGATGARCDWVNGSVPHRGRRHTGRSRKSSF